MEFGIALPVFGRYARREEILEAALKAEGLGYGSLWVSDHIVIPDSHKVFGDVFYDPLITLAFLSSATKKIKLGTSVLVLPYRNPIVLAKMVSTLDTLSRGRVILGVGSGWLREEFDALGVAFDERGGMTDEYINIMKELWTSAKPSYDGEYIKFSQVRFLPKPVQRPHPPVWVGGGGERAIERAVRYGDGWHPVGFTPEGMKAKAGYVRSLLSEEKRGNFAIALRRNVEINEERDFGAEETLRGGIGKIIEGVRAYRNAGVTHLIIYILSGDFEGVLGTMKTFAEEVIPAAGD